jgi:methylated-DNA-protein-cysteine methyltransferase-like protein
MESHIYGAIAKALGTPARMVGWAMNASHNRDDVPAHRVVNRNGLLTGKSILMVLISCSNC